MPRADDDARTSVGIRRTRDARGRERARSGEHLLIADSPWSNPLVRQAAEYALDKVALNAAFGLILTGYIAGRLVELFFTHFLEPSGIFCWRSIDSYFRLVTGRRNPNLILLTLGLVFLRPTHKEPDAQCVQGIRELIPCGRG